MLVGHMRRLVMTMVVALGLVLTPATGGETIRAAGPATQDVPEPPAVGEPFFHSDLTSPEVFTPGACPTGGALGEYVEEGFRLTVRGRCREDLNQADLAVLGREVAITDGEVAVDFKTVAGAARAGLNLTARVRGGAYVTTYVSLATGQAELFKRERGSTTALVRTQSLGEIDPTNWNRLALRLRGGEAWLLLNDAPILHLAEAVDHEGAIGISAVREGDPDDGDEVAVVFRNLELRFLLSSAPDEAAPESEQPEPAPESE